MAPNLGAPPQTGLSALTMDRLTVLVACVDTRSLHMAAKRVGKSVRSIEPALNHLRKELGYPLFEDESHKDLKHPTTAAVQASNHAKRILRLAREIMDCGRGDSAEQAAIFAYLPHHAAFVAQFIVDSESNSTDDDGIPKVSGYVLDERHRSVDEFQADALGRLAIDREFYFVIGPPPEKDPRNQLEVFPLYEAQLVALVPKDYTDLRQASDGTLCITMESLAKPSEVSSKNKLLIPPRTTRAGSKIQSQLLRWLGESEQTVNERVKLRAHGTKVLAMYAAAGLGIVVVPSDIAFSFGPRGVLGGGEELGRLTWVSVRNNDHEPLTHEVVATFRHEDAWRQGTEEIMSRLRRCIARRFYGDETIRMLSPDHYLQR